MALKLKLNARELVTLSSLSRIIDVDKTDSGAFRARQSGIRAPAANKVLMNPN